MPQRAPKSRAAASALALLLALSICGCAPRLACADWGPSGNVVPNVVDLGPPPSCLPGYTKLNLNRPYDVFDKLLFNQIIALAVAEGASPYITQLSAWALAGWNAVALYDSTAQPAIDMGISRRPLAQCTLRNRNRALAAALLRIHELNDPFLGAASAAILKDSVPKGTTGFQFNANCTETLASYDIPECVGFKAAQVTYDRMIKDGWNIDGALSRQYNKAPYSDTTGYTPKNTPWDLQYPCKWQPLHETDRRGKTWIQTHLLPYSGNITPFFIDAASGLNRRIPMWDCSNNVTYQANVDEILTYSANLNDTTKMITELMGPKPFMLITGMMLRDTKRWSITDVMAFNLMSVIAVDAQVGIILREKLRHDAVRPASAVRYVYGHTTVTAYAGYGQGTKVIPGKDWLPYLSTFNEGEFPSGAMCWCTILNEWIELWQGGRSNPKSTEFSPPLNFTTPKGCSLREPYVSPTKETSITISNTQEYIKYCKEARIIGGVHFRPAMDGGFDICTGVTTAVWPKILKLYPKLNISPPPPPASVGPPPSPRV